MSKTFERLNRNGHPDNFRGGQHYPLVRDRQGLLAALWAAFMRKSA